MLCLGSCLVLSVFYAVIVLVGDLDCVQGTFLDTCSYFLTYGVFHLFERLLESLLGPSAVAGGLQTVQSLCDSPRNPIGVIIFMILYIGCGWGVMQEMLSRVERCSWMPHTAYTVVAVLWLCAVMATFCLVCCSDPGRITDSNQVQMLELFPSDGFLRTEKVCPTCLRMRAPRAKHHHGHCIAMFDHYCVWVGNSIGLFNMRYFVLFLFVTSLACLHGASVGVTLMYCDLKERGYWERIFRGSHTWPLLLLFRLAANQYNLLSGLVAFLSICAVALLMFLCLHMYQIMKGITTYEATKLRSMDQSVAAMYLGSKLDPRRILLALRPMHYLDSISQRKTK